MKTETKRLLAHLRTMRGMVARIEREANIPTGTLGYFLNGKRGLTESNTVKLTTVLKKYGYKTLES